MRAKSAQLLSQRYALLRLGFVIPVQLFSVCLCLVMTLAASLPAPVSAQTIQTLNYDQTNWRAYRASLEQQFGVELQEIADWCRANGIPKQVEQTFKVYVNRDPGRQYISLPDERSMPTLPENVPDLLKEWFGKVNQAKRNHAERIFDLAKQAAAQDRGTIAFQYLNDVVYYNRDHVEVRKMLGHRKTKDGWKVASDSVRVRPRKTDHDILNWQGGEYIQVLTPHFEIESNASEEQTRYLAQKLERWHDVWRQVFFEYWSSPKAVKNWIAGKSSLRMSTKRFRVVFCKDRAEYLRQLGPLVPGVKISTGYYSAKMRASFFYDGNEKVQDTWRHEVTHQLFKESGGAKGTNLEEQFIWLDEGIATYFESLKDFGGYVTLGGFDASRLQYARIRRLYENFHVPVRELSAIGRSDLQKRLDVVRLYSEAAGLTHMLMNDENGAYEERLGDFLKFVYKGRLKPGTFEKIIGKSFEELDLQYLQYLVVDSNMVERRLHKPEKLTELSLPAANLSLAAFEAIGECKNLNWLDLSKNSISLSHFSQLKQCQKINQLILTDCRFQLDSLRGLEFFPALDDIDLSGSSVHDAQLTHFRNLRSLKTLQLTGTGITDAGLMQLATVPNLKEVDVSRSRVTDAGIANLRAVRPGLRVTK